MDFEKIENYDYTQEMLNDLSICFKDWLLYHFNDYEDHKDELTKEEIAQDFEEFARDDDIVTGNMSGSYTMSRWKAQLLVMTHIDELADALEDYGYDDTEIADMMLRNQEYEKLDVIIRFHHFDEAFGDFRHNGTFDEILDDEISKINTLKNGGAK